MRASLISLLLSLFLLFGCSPHTASGYWIAAADSTSKYSRIDVHFEARLEIYGSNQKKAALYCGWSASSKQSLELECMASKDINDKEIYQFKINGNTAELIYKNEVIGRFTRKPD